MARSLRASEDGIKQIKSAMKGVFTQKALAEALAISRSTITVLLRGEAINRTNFEELCTFLELDWRDIRGEEVVSDDLDLLVKEVKQKIEAYVRYLCGTMRVLDREQPVDLERIYTNVNILEKISSNNYVDCEEVLSTGNKEDFDRWMMGQVKEHRIAGLEAVETHKKLMVLGKPGSGKTTFLKYLAISCLKGKFHSELVPIFVTLKRYSEVNGSPSLEEYILDELQHWKVTEKEAKLLLDNGKVLILLDGLDEVKNEHDDRVRQNIETFSIRWLKNRFAITCRIAAKGYVFERFTDVEVADFDDEQIDIFVTKWFLEKGQTNVVILLEKLNSNQPVKELAKTPLLLVLICYLFENGKDLSTKRSDLYKDGLEVLMKKWDAKRKIERDQIYIQHLSLQDKQNMLGQIALRGFENGKYFFQKEDLQRQIEDICSLPNSDDGEAVLKAIENHHGLLVERARNIYSFSHLTFQEYFTAREIEREHKLETLMQHLTDPHWKEVFLLTAEMLKRSDDFLCLMKTRIDEMLVGDEKLQALLQSVVKKIDSVKSTSETSTVRWFYFDLSCEFPVGISSNLDHYLYQSFNLDVCLSYSLLYDIDFLLASFDLEHSISVANNLGNNVLQQVLQRLQDRLPDRNSGQEIRSQWREINGKEWRNELRQVCIEHRNIGHDWQFTDEQKELLKKYHEANHLLVQCMNHSYVSKQVREEIESTLLLPREK